MVSASSLPKAEETCLQTFPRYFQQKLELSGSCDRLENPNRMAEVRQQPMGRSWDQLTLRNTDNNSRKCFPPPIKLPSPQNAQNPNYEIYSDVKSPGVYSPHSSFSYSELQSPGLARMYDSYDVNSPNNVPKYNGNGNINYEFPHIIPSKNRGSSISLPSTPGEQKPTNAFVFPETAYPVSPVEPSPYAPYTFFQNSNSASSPSEQAPLFSPLPCC